VSYSEGLLVGYRGFDRSGAEPLFWFGRGLGYTELMYESLEAATASDVVVRIRNSGTRAGREVVHLYLEGPEDDPSRPLRALAAFAAISAEPGETVAVKLALPARAFERFDESRRDWVFYPGTCKLWAGRSSRDLRLSAEVVIR
jgi:beta-glucosidase